MVDFLLPTCFKLVTVSVCLSTLSQSERGLRAGGGARFANGAARRRRHLLRLLQDHAGVEIREYLPSKRNV